MPRSLRVLNVVTALVTLASALAVLVSSLVDPGYRAHHRDPLWLVALYIGFYAVVLRAFARATPAAPWLAVAKAAGASVFLGVCAVLPWLSIPADVTTAGLRQHLFLASFATISRAWIALTPGRYVYQLFDWGPDATIGFVAFVFLGRGAWNIVNAFALTRDRWMRLRLARPFFGRLVTAVPVSATVLCMWGFLFVARLETRAVSPEAREVARAVFDGLECADVRAKNGTTTTDVRQRGERRYEVMIAWGCETTGVLVRTPDDRIGTIVGRRSECCRE